ncbi:crotonase/enoyl-CoA hydratase family protein [Microbacterium sp. NPDC055910]|uniref:crotonase/enoyl-CoA hydratase family protein n=1 Tax=Microbacterium sp. NPDC055910 TaxID=3345659 RepID=UPI0035DC1EEC
MTAEQAAADEVLLREETDGVLVLTMNRPAARNAMSLELATRLAAAFEEFDARPELRVAVLTGAGGTFCAGMDLKGFSRGEIPIIEGRGFGGLVEQTPAKPLIAAVEGWALGGGFELALASDLIVAADTATFGLPEVKRGLTANAGGLLRLPRRIPYHRAMELILTGRPLPATEAQDLGLVTTVTAAGGALDAARELAATIAANAPLAVATSKRIIRESPDWPADEMFTRQHPIVQRIRESDDAKEGARAFAEKRSPVWTAS